MRPAALALCAAAIATTQASAQDWQVMTHSRQARGEESLRVSVRFLSGYITVAPAARGVLYHSAMTFDADEFDPSMRYDASSRRFRVSLTANSTGTNIDVDKNSQQRLDLLLAQDVPLNLTLELGAIAGDIELGGLALERADIGTGASETVVRFSRPNTISCSRLEVAAGAAQLEVINLGNSNCARVEVKGGVGDLTVDLTGTWPVEESRLNVKVGLGHVTLRIPRSLGVHVHVNRLLASFDKTGFVRRGSAYVSQEYDTAQRKLAVRIDAVFGDVDVVWVDDIGR